jgi:general secretion pathway protein L
VRSASAPIRSGVSRFLAWWGGELGGIVSGASRRKSAASAGRYLVCVEAAGLSLVDLKTSANVTPAARQLAARPQHEVLLSLADLARSGAATAINLRLPSSAYFVRRLELPLAAANDFQTLLTLDFERTMPFKLTDVYLAHVVDEAPASVGKVWVRQLIVKRRAVDPLRAAIDGVGLEVGCLDCWDAETALPLPVNFLGRENASRTANRSSRSAWVMAAAIIGLLGLGTVLSIQKYELALQDIQIQTDRQKQKAKTVREALAKSQTAFTEISNFYRLRSDAVSKLSVIEELTRLLPDSAWVTDLKIDGATVDISGFAKGAAALVPLLERSAMFVNATPTAPLTFDPREDKERFSIRVQIRKAVTNIEPGPEASR